LTWTIALAEAAGQLRDAGESLQEHKRKAFAGRAARYPNAIARPRVLDARLHAYAPAL